MRVLVWGNLLKQLYSDMSYKLCFIFSSFTMLGLLPSPKGLTDGVEVATVMRRPPLLARHLKHSRLLPTFVATHFFSLTHIILIKGLFVWALNDILIGRMYESVRVMSFRLLVSCTDVGHTFDSEWVKIILILNNSDLLLLPHLMVQSSYRFINYTFRSCHTALNLI